MKPGRRGNLDVIAARILTGMVAALLLLLVNQTVTLRYESATAKEVLFAGDVVGWSEPKPMTKEGANWSITFNLPEDARFEYKFVVDDNWILDPKNPRKGDNGVGGQNSIYEGPEYKLHTNEGTPKQPLQRSIVKLPQREVVVFAPKKSDGLPLFLYGDGENYEKYGKIQNVVQNLVESGKIKPVILVLIPPIDRMNEYGAGWKSYGEMLIAEVLPTVRALTQASDKAEDVYLGGSSMGGLISLRLAEEFPDHFAGGVHSQSGAFLKTSFGDFSSVIASEGFRKLAPNLRLWLCWGAFEGDLSQANEDAVAQLTRLGRKFASKKTNEGHNWTAWRNRMEEALVYLLGK